MTHIPAASYPICPFCTKQVELEKANTDEKGQAVHEDCYVAHILGKRRIFKPLGRDRQIARAPATPLHKWAAA
jgi:hypothetical protein